jgi:hypothetical protein
VSTKKISNEFSKLMLSLTFITPIKVYIVSINLENLQHFIESRGSAVGIATGYELDDRGGRSSSPGRVKICNISIPFRPALGPNQPPVQWVSEGCKAAGS